MPGINLPIIRILPISYDSVSFDNLLVVPLRVVDTNRGIEDTNSLNLNTESTATY